jgi:translation initiation factor 4A
MKVSAAGNFVEGVEEVFETNWELEVSKFDDMGLKEEVLRGIYGYGFKEPSRIQQKGILPLIQGKDTIAQVRTNKRLYL